MATFRSLNALYSYLQRQVESAMDNEVSDVVKEVESEKVKEVVYDAYKSQEPYSPRRMDNGGLSDTKNMTNTISVDGNTTTLEIKNITQGHEMPSVSYTSGTTPPNYLAGIIEYGRPDHKGLYTTNATGTQDQYLQARPFEEETVNELNNTKQHVEALKKSLQSKGIRVE